MLGNILNLQKNDTLIKVDGNTLDQVKENLESTNEKADLVVYEKDGKYYLTFKVQLQFY